MMTLNDSNAIPRKVTGRKILTKVSRVKVTMLCNTKKATVLKTLSRQVIPFFSSFNLVLPLFPVLGRLSFSVHYRVSR